MIFIVNFFALPLQQKENLTPWTKPLGSEACSYMALTEDTHTHTHKSLPVSYDLTELFNYAFSRVSWNTDLTVALGPDRLTK
jgi:hypothetical protein